MSGANFISLMLSSRVGVWHLLTEHIIHTNIKKIKKTTAVIGQVLIYKV
jgi:hypothetical protein